jgi:hypothetical protein
MNGGQITYLISHRELIMLSNMRCDIIACGRKEYEQIIE